MAVHPLTCRSCPPASMVEGQGTRFQRPPRPSINWKPRPVAVSTSRRSMSGCVVSGIMESGRIPDGADMGEQPDGGWLMVRTLYGLCRMLDQFVHDTAVHPLRIPFPTTQPMLAPNRRQHTDPILPSMSSFHDLQVVHHAPDGPLRATRP